MNVEARGHNGTVIFDGNMVTIARRGFLARATIGKGEKRIPLRAVTAVQWKPAGITYGFISFSLGGGIEKQSRFGRQTQSAGQDENAVRFTRRQMAAMSTVRDAIEHALATV